MEKPGKGKPRPYSTGPGRPIRGRVGVSLAGTLAEDCTALSFASKVNSIELAWGSTFSLGNGKSS